MLNALSKQLRGSELLVETDVFQDAADVRKSRHNLGLFVENNFLKCQLDDGRLFAATVLNSEEQAVNLGLL